MEYELLRRSLLTIQEHYVLLWLRPIEPDLLRTGFTLPIEFANTPFNPSRPDHAEAAKLLLDLNSCIVDHILPLASEVD